MNQALMCVEGKAEQLMRRMEKRIGGVRDGKKGAEGWRPSGVPDMQSLDRRSSDMLHPARTHYLLSGSALVRMDSRSRKLCRLITCAATCSWSPTFPTLVNSRALALACRLCEYVPTKSPTVKFRVQLFLKVISWRKIFWRGKKVLLFSPGSLVGRFPTCF